MKPEDVKATVTLDEVRRAVAVAAGREAGSLLLKNATLLNVLTQDIDDTHVLLAGRLIAGVGPDYADAAADEVVDLGGKHLAPGLIDGHVHIESSLVTPGAYAAGVVPRGVTAVVCDPHEIGNVAGVPGIEWLLERSERLPLDVWVTVPSCVPSTPMETAGATLGLAEIAGVLAHRRVVGVAEIMSFPAVIAGDEENLAKALLAEQYGKTPEGHAPGVSGRDLQAYLASGIGSDHESTTLAEGQEKLRAGAFLMIREGSVTRNLDALLPLVKPETSDRIGFVTDDRLPGDVCDEGGVDFLVRRAIASGVAPALAVRCGSWSTARHYRLVRRGAVAPGYFADLAVVDDVANYHVSRVYKEGRLVAADGKLCVDIPEPQVDDTPVRNTVHLPELSAERFRLAAPAAPTVRCIRPVPYQVLTEEVRVTPTVVGGEVVADPTRDLAKLVCVERHGHSGDVGVGLVTGFGLQRGALASTVGHDHHNLLAVGVDDEDIRVACERLEHLEGGFVAVDRGEVLAELPLPFAGLLTDRPLKEVSDTLERLDAAARELGVTLPAPYMALSFLGLAVIPELRLTDQGLVDVRPGRLVSFAAEDVSAS
ncbi:MAG: adenine deaminase [Trueperaceae bacterium]|nr:adenine deaminase [Trueperaceae bacterium]